MNGARDAGAVDARFSDARSTDAVTPDATSPDAARPDAIVGQDGAAADVSPSPFNVSVQVTDGSVGCFAIHIDFEAQGDAAATFRIYRNGMLVAETVNSSFVDEGLSQGTTYRYTISAVRADGVESTLSPEVSFDTHTQCRYAAPSGSDTTGDGSKTRPWQTLPFALADLVPGDLLLLREGSYAGNGYYTAVTGTADAPVVVKSYPGERAAMDGSLQDLSWEVIDAARHIYRTVDVYPWLTGADGYFREGGQFYHLVSYENEDDFLADNEFFSDEVTVAYYAGPGVFFNATDQHLYIRLQPSSVEAVLIDYGIPEITNPNDQVLHLWGTGTVGLHIGSTTSHLSFEGMDFLYSDRLFRIIGGAHHIGFRDSVFRGGYDVIIHGGAHDIVIERNILELWKPPWICRSDVKRGKLIAAPTFRAYGVGTNGPGAYNIAISDNVFYEYFDGIIMVALTHDVTVTGNTFTRVVDDAMQLGSSSYNIEFAYNYVTGSGPSHHGTGDSLYPGTKFFHHNIFDSSEQKFLGRTGETYWKYVGFGWMRPFAAHTGAGFGGGDPWKLYNNTILGGDDASNFGLGIQGVRGDGTTIEQHEVYNNILVQVANHWILRGADASSGRQVYDGNVYYRSDATATEWLFLQIWDGVTSLHHRTLANFQGAYATQTSAYYPPGWESTGVEGDPRLDGNYVPDSGGVAGQPGVDLGATGWPDATDGSYHGAIAP